MRRFDMYVPEDMPDLLTYLDKHSTGVHLIANGSDLINRIQRRQIEPKTLVDLSGLKELSYVRKDGNTIQIGALTTISELTNSPIIDDKHAVFREVAAKFGGPSITNVATIGGNICAASSSEDLLPVFLVLDAKVKMRSVNGERVMGLEEFLIGKRLTDLRSNEILTETMFEGLQANSACAFEKIGMRNSLIIAFVSTAVYIKLQETNRTIEDAKIAFNRVRGKIPQRAKQTEKTLIGKNLTETVLENAQRALRDELQLTGDFRVSGQYRTHVACTLFTQALSRCAEELGETIIV